MATRAPAEAALPGFPSRLPMLRRPGLLGGETWASPHTAACPNLWAATPLFPSPLPAFQVPGEQEAEVQRPLQSEETQA